MTLKLYRDNMATATKIQLVEFTKDGALNGASLAFSSNGQLSGTVGDYVLNFQLNDNGICSFILQIVQRAKDHKGENKKVKESAIKTISVTKQEAETFMSNIEKLI